MRREFESVWKGGLNKAILYGLTLVHLASNGGTTIPDVVIFEEVRIMRRRYIFGVGMDFIEGAWIVFILWSDEMLRREHLKRGLR